VLPPQLDEYTVHVHDLYFLEIFDDLADKVVQHIPIADVDTPRRHEQRFDNVVAVSSLDETCAVGAERGRVATFAKDQYMPFTAHFLDDDTVAAVGVKLGDATSTVDAHVDDTQTATLVANGHDGVVELILVLSSEPTVTGPEVRIGSFVVTFSAVPSTVRTDVKTTGTELRMSFDLATITMTAHRVTRRSVT
jgi:hypothetical protein